MILSLLTILTAFYWLLKETNWLTVNLALPIPEPIQMIERRKYSPILEPCVIKTVSYPKPKPILLLTEMCGFTTTQNKIVKEKWKAINADDFMNNPRCWASYQSITIGGHTLTILATSHKLYDVIAEARKIADDKIRNESYSKLRQTKEPRTCKMIYNPDSGNDEPHYESNCLFPIEWLNAHINDVMPEPLIELTVNGKSLSLNGDYRTGKIHDFMVLNAEIWERPRIKGKKVKAEVTA